MDNEITLRNPDHFASSRAQLPDTLAAVDYMRAKLTATTDVVHLRAVEDMAVHCSNMLARTPCADNCPYCQGDE